MTEADDTVAAPAPASRSTRWVWVALATSVLAVAATFWWWQQADSDPDRARAALRDLAIIEGTAAVETMNSMDHRDVDAGLTAWQSVTTGVLHDQLLSIADDERQLLAEQQKVATAQVVEAALTELTDRTATMIVAVEITVVDSDPEVEPTVKRNRFTTDLVRVEETWKIESLTQVPVSL